MVEMVHDLIAAGETTVVSTAAVLRCGKQMENYRITTFPGQSLSKTGLSLEDALDLSRDGQIEEEDIVLHADMYGYENWYLNPVKEHGLKTSQNRKNAEEIIWS
jgi:hypothetical protein